MNPRNYQRELERLLQTIEKETKAPRLLLHSCCAPCSSYVLEYLSQYFEITVFYYNPNIYPPKEYEERSAEQKRFVETFSGKYPIHYVEGAYDTDRFYEMAKGLEKVSEGGERCFRCYELRMREAAIQAKEGNYDYFTTTLTISPLKNAGKLNEIGEQLEKEYGIKHLPSDFKKKNGYQRSVELSREYELYRQNYCGCVFSKMERENSCPNG